MAVGIVLNRSRQVPAEDTPAFGAIAERFRRAGDLDRAVALCREGLRKFPDHLSARVTLGWSLLDQGHYDEARAELQQVLKRAPDNLAAIRGLAELHDRAESTIELSLTGPGPWPPDAAAIESAVEENAAATVAADDSELVDPPADLAGAARTFVQNASLEDEEQVAPAAAAEIEPVEVLRPADVYRTAASTVEEAPTISTDDATSVETAADVAAEAQDALAASRAVDAAEIGSASPSAGTLDGVSLAESSFAAPDPTLAAAMEATSEPAGIAAMQATEAADAVSLDADLAVSELEELLVDNPAATAAVAASEPSVPESEVVLDAERDALLDPAAAIAVEPALEPLLLEADAPAMNASDPLVDLDADASGVALESLLEPTTPLAAEPIIDDEAPLVLDEAGQVDVIAPVAAAEAIETEALDAIVLEAGEEQPDGAAAFNLTAPDGSVDLSLESAALALSHAEADPLAPGTLALDFDAQDPEPITPVYLMDADLREATDIREAVELASTFMAPPAPEPVLVSVAPTPEPVSAPPVAPVPENQPAEAAPAARKRKGEPDPSVARFEKMLEGIAIRRIQSSAYNLAG